MAKRIFLTHNLYSTITMPDGVTLAFQRDQLELDDENETHKPYIAELDKIANRSAIYTPESGLTASPVELAQAQVAGQLAAQAATAQLGEANDTNKMLGNPLTPSTLTNNSAAEAAAKLLASRNAPKQ